MELTRFLAILAVVLPIAYGAPTAAADSLHPQILEAMKRDLGLNAEEATIRVAREIKATDVIDALRTSTGASFAGAWVSENGAKINVGITDESLAEHVKAAGATPTIFSTSLAKLQEAQKALDKLNAEQVKLFDAEANTGIAAYFVDVAANKLVIEALSGSIEHAKDLAAQVGLTEAEFQVETVEELPSTFATIQGGNAYYINNSARCSIGFTVTTGFVSAGHCGKSGNTASTSAGATLGTFSGSVFPGSADMSYIRSSSGNTLSGTVNNYSGGSIRISGSTATGVGGSICRSGSTTGVYCGSVSSLGATVNYSQGSVTGLTRTNVCAEPGDSGGSWYTGAQAQGVTSGGSGNCASGGTTYFQPVNEILSTYGLTLVKG
jgi:streptogrisin C